MRVAHLMVSVFLVACAVETAPPEPFEAISLLGDTLRSQTPAPERLASLQANLDSARAMYQRNPNDADAIIWYGRRSAYLGEYGRAIEIFGEGISKFPDDARMYRHRGHRYITLRQFDNAIADFQLAVELIAERPDEVEPDGQPNALNIPTSTLHTNIWYHLGLAYYVTGNLEAAIDAFGACREAATNPDMEVAATYWYYLALRRSGDLDDAAESLTAITADLTIIENHSYHQLLLLYKGERSVNDVRGGDSSGDVALANTTTSYGIGAWHLMESRESEALREWKGILTGDQWPAFGFIAAEAELASRIP